MVQINFAQKEIQCKIVYYGPGMSGKTTNLELVHAKAPDDHRGELTSIATTGERTLYFDYMPLDLGQIAGISTKFQLYTVPGQIYYKSTRRLVLQGVDGIVFVADSSAAKLRENKESLADLEDNLREMGKDLADVPIVMQYNKRDLPDAMEVETLEAELNPHGFPYVESTATLGDGVFPTLKQLAGMVLEAVNKGGLAAPRAPKKRTVAKAPATVGASASPQSATAPVPPGPTSGSPTTPASAETAPAGDEPPLPPPPSLAEPPPSLAKPPVGLPGLEGTEPASTRTTVRDLEDRLVSVSNLGDGANTRALLVLFLGTLIAGAIYVLTTRI